MKKFYPLIIIILSFNFINAQCPTFSISAPSGTVVGCNPNYVQLSAVNTSSYTNVTYTWTSVSTGTTTGANINGMCPSGSNTYVVMASSPTSSCVDTQTISLSQNLAVPGVTVNPITGTLACNGPAKTFTASTSYTVGVVGQWFTSAGAPTTSLSSTPCILAANSPDIYTFVCTNLTNGCTVSNTVAVTSSTIVPTMTVNALAGYTLNCTQPCLQFNITGGAGPAPKTYTWTNLQTSVSSMPVSGGYTVCNPGGGAGNYLAQYRDGNGCTVSQQVNISIDTVRLIPGAISNLAGNSFTVNCYNPVLIATAISNPMLPASNYSWTVPPSLTIAKDTISVTAASVTSNPTTFTVLAATANGCIGKQKIFFYKDITIPTYKAVFTPSAITCSSPSIAMSPQYMGGPLGPVNFTFTSPAPTTTANTSGATFTVPGTYTMNYQYLFNGCQGVAITNVPLNITAASTVALPALFIPCGALITIVNAGTVTQPSSQTYTWTGPSGSGMSCSTCYTTTVNTPGIYTVVISNSSNGCATNNTVAVLTSTALVVAFSPSITNCTPLTVNFANNTILGSTSSGTVYTTWNYGNGPVMSYTNSSFSGSPNGSATYTASGVYTVNLNVTQTAGTTTCSGTSSNTINVTCVGIEEYENSAGITIQPNPNNGQFTVKINSSLDNAELRIMNNLGQEVAKQKVFTGNNPVNVSLLSKGIYYYVMDVDKRPFSKGKILVQ